MRPLPSARRLALAALCLTASACDSGNDPDDLVGSWNLDSQSLAIVGVSDETQEGLDYGGIGTGSMAITGAFSARPLYLGGRAIDADGETTSITLTDVSLTQVDDRVALDLSANSAQLRRVDENGATLQTFTLDTFDGTAVATFDDDGVEVQRARLVDAESGDAVVVRGTFAYARRTYVADQETVIVTQAIPEASYATLGSYERVAFEENGDFEAVSADPEIDDVEGSWEAGAEGEVRVRIDGEGSTTYAFEVDGSTLQLTAELDNPAFPSCDAACAENLETLLGLDDGSLDDVRIDIESRYSARGSANDRPARAAAAAPRPDASLDITRLLGGRL